jgi:protein-L-isoaspartate(D-aspartate) O-methyltransferase
MERINKAFQQIDRRNFVPPHLRQLAALDGPLPIGYNQTISQPTTVRLMLKWLNVQPTDKVLDIGSGSGWSSALLAYLTGPRGQVWAVERIPALVKFGRANCRRIGLKNVKFYKAGENYGLAKFAPYDRILVSAAAQQLPHSLLDQLNDGGKLVIPVSYDILEITKINSDKINCITHPGFIFVPLI